MLDFHRLFSSGNAAIRRAGERPAPSERAAVALVAGHRLENVVGHRMWQVCLTAPWLGIAMVVGASANRSTRSKSRLWPIPRGGGGGSVKRPPQQPTQLQYANYWAPLTHKRHSPPHPAQPRHTNHWAPRTRKRHQQEHRPQRPTERSDPTQHAKGRTGDCPGPRKETTTRRNVTRGGGQRSKKKVCGRKVDLQFRAPFMNFLFFPEEKLADVGGWVGGWLRLPFRPFPPPVLRIWRCVICSFGANARRIGATGATERAVQAPPLLQATGGFSLGGWGWGTAVDGPAASSGRVEVSSAVRARKQRPCVRAVQRATYERYAKRRHARSMGQMAVSWASESCPAQSPP